MDFLVVVCFFVLFYLNGKLEKRRVGLNPNTPVQLKQVAATLGNTISTNLLAEDFARLGDIFGFFLGMVTFCLCRENHLSGLSSTV